MRQVPEAGDVVRFDASQVSSEHQRCQFCGEHNQISGDAIDIEDDAAIQDCTCDYCGARWRDRYIINEREFLEVPF